MASIYETFGEIERRANRVDARSQLGDVNRTDDAGERGERIVRERRRNGAGVNRGIVDEPSE